MKKEPLTKAQEKAYTAINQFYKKNRCMPTYAELAEILGVPDSSVHATCKRIATKGWIQQDRRPRRMKVL